MRKIPTLFVRDPATNLRHVLDRVTPGCEWVADGVGIPTRKFDGSCCLVRAGVLYRRHEVKPGKATPPGFEPVDHDPDTGKTVGWVPVGDGPEDRWHREAFVPSGVIFFDGTYELVGPKVQGNPEGYEVHTLVRHGWIPLEGDVPRDFAGLAAWLHSHPYEGIVWHHPDGRMVKIKRRDFPVPS